MALLSSNAFSSAIDCSCCSGVSLSSFTATSNNSGDKSSSSSKRSLKSPICMNGTLSKSDKNASHPVNNNNKKCYKVVDYKTIEFIYVQSMCLIVSNVSKIMKYVFNQ